MAAKDKIRAHARNAFICIALMMFTFLILVLVMVAPLGLPSDRQMMVVRIALYVLLAFALLGGMFSLYVAWLRKQIER